MRPIWGTLLVCGGAALAACSSGSEVAATYGTGGGGSPAQGSGGEGAASASASASSSGANGSSSGTSSGSGASSSSGQGGAGGGCSFSAPDTCLTAVQLDNLDGDTGSDSRTAKGTTSAWYKVLIHEGSNFSNALSYTATLVSPPGQVFELFEYPGDGSTPNCVADAVLGVGNPPSVSDKWSDTLGTDDSRWISLEVRYISGEACSPAPEWTLTVKGHTN